MKKQDRRVATEQKILFALESLILERGFNGLSLNGVARRAGVSKALIYRYFGGLKEMVHALMQDHDYWSVLGARGGLSDAAAEALPPEEQLARMLKGQIESLRAQPDIQEIRRWELVQRNELTERLGADREKASLRFVNQLRAPPDVDLPAISGLLLAGAIHLILRSKTSRWFFGIDLRSNQGWERLEAAIQWLCQSALKDGAGEQRPGAAQSVPQPGAGKDRREQ